jgi:hypothetical protein
MPRNDDDEDDRPRKRRRPRDDEDDDRPPARRSRADEDDDDRPRARSRDREGDSEEDDYDDRPRRKRRKKKQAEISLLGILSLVTGGFALGWSFTCFGGLAIIPGLIGLGLGIFGFLTAQNSRGRQSPILPIGGAALSLAACVVATIGIVSFFRTAKEIEKEMVKYEQEEAARQRELAKAPAEVKAAAPANVHFLTADQFYQFYDFENDGERFDRAYKNKIIELTGVVDEVDFTGEEYTVLLKAGRQDETVACQFAKDPNARALLGQLRPGQQVRIRGKCLGGFPGLEACILVQ